MRWLHAGVRLGLVHCCACVQPRNPGDPCPGGSIPRDALFRRCPSTGHRALRDDTVAVLRRAALEDDRVVAISELGLDLFRDKNLEEQLAVPPSIGPAVELNLPVIIHCRDTAEPMLEELQPARRRAVAEGDALLGRYPDEMHQFLELGFYISFSGTVTFPKAEPTYDCAVRCRRSFSGGNRLPLHGPCARPGSTSHPTWLPLPRGWLSCAAISTAWPAATPPMPGLFGLHNRSSKVSSPYVRCCIGWPCAGFRLVWCLKRPFPPVHLSSSVV